MNEIIQHLDSASRRTRRLLIGRRVAVLISSFLVLLSILILLDWLIRFSPGIRSTSLVLVMVVFISWTILWLFPVLSFLPTRHRMALQLEDREPSLRGYLASSLEFESSGVSETSSLAAASVLETRRRFQRVSVDSIINPSPARWSLALLLIILGCSLITIILEPGFTRLGFTRVMAPWSSIEWPPRTAVSSRMHEIVPEHGVHGQGIPLLLRAENRTRDHTDDPVEAVYRIIEDGVPSEWNTVMLTYQRDGIHERLISTSGEAIEVGFMTSDAQTEHERIILMPLPQVTSLTLDIEPPPHAVPWLKDRRIESTDTGPRLDVIRPPVLQGSRARLDLQLNRSILIPDEGPSRSEWLMRTFGLAEGVEPPELMVDEDDPKKLSLTWQADDTRRMLISLQDEFGLESVEPVPVYIPVEEDLAPDVVLVEPEQDLDILPTAVIPLVAEAVDNLPLHRVGITVMRGEGEQVDGHVKEVETERSRISTPFDVSASGVVEGDLLEVRGIASDRWRDESGNHRESSSRVRTLRVISETEFLTQLRDQMSLLEQRAMDLEDTQKSVQNQYQDIISTTQEDDDAIETEDADNLSSEQQDGTPSEFSDSETRYRQSLERRQSDISRRLSDQQNQVEAIRDWIGDNMLDEERIESVLDQVEEALADAQESSAEAMRSMEASRPSEQSESSPEGTDPSDSTETAAEQDQETLQSQQDVREALQDVVAALAEDQETWLISRQVENIQSRQQSLQDLTRSLSEQTRGQYMDELSPEIQSAIEDAAREQEALTDAMSQLTESMTAQAEAMREMDPSGASAMEQAAELAEQQDVESMMSEAAEEIEQGRLEMAGGSQQEIMEALQSMQEAMSPDQQDRIADLLRRLVDLETAIEELIDLQADELVTLDDAIVRNDFSGRDAAVIEIRKRTLAVSDEARNRSDEERGLSRRLDRAGDSQSDSISVLRAVPVDGASARDHQLVALQQLRSALEDLKQVEAEAQQEMVEADRASLAQSYRELAQQQVDIQVRTNPILVADPSKRRVRHEARRLSLDQETIGEGSRTLRESNEEINERPIFMLMHTRIEEASKSSQEALSDAQLGPRIQRLQGRIAQDLFAMAESLEQEDGAEEEFERGSQSGGSGSQGQAGSGEGEDGVLPPIAELRLLRSLQLDVMNSTRDLDRDDLIDPEDRLREIRRLSDLQSDLSRLGQEMFDCHTNDGMSDVMPQEAIPPSFNLQLQDTGIEEPGEQAARRRPRSLDELLGLEEQNEGSVDATPLPASHDPLEAIVEEMERAAMLIGQDLVTGPPTQRLQQDILLRIDSLIDQANEQQSSQSSSSQSSSSNQNQQQNQQSRPEQSNQQQQAQGSITEAQLNEGDEGDERSPLSGLEETRLGGALEETDQEWGALPARVRDLLRQGRRDTYSNVYEQLTGEYYRRLAEEQNAPK